jgi:glycerol-3-phosphate dehydrogenase (NAD(P)+)
MFDFLILGGGAMATSMAYLLSKNGQRTVLMWLRNKEKALAIKQLKENSEYLPGVILPNTLTVTDDIVEALGGSDKIVLAVPSHAVRALVNQIQGHINPKRVKFLSVIKGLDHSSGKRISLLVTDSLGIPLEHFAVLSGPNFATELAGDVPSVMVIASPNSETLLTFKSALESERLIIYSSDDLAGVEIASVLKNIIAIAIGIVDGLGFGANTRGAVFAICMKEALDIGRYIFGAKPETILGPACLGDAITTGFSSKSRNYLLGLLLAKKASLGNSDVSFICEGKNNIRIVKDLVAKHGINAPITEFVWQIINGINAYQAFSHLWTNMQSLHFNDEESL